MTAAYIWVDYNVNLICTSSLSACHELSLVSKRTCCGNMWVQKLSPVDQTVLKILKLVRKGRKRFVFDEESTVFRYDTSLKTPRIFYIFICYLLLLLVPCAYLHVGDPYPL